VSPTEDLIQRVAYRLLKTGWPMPCDSVLYDGTLDEVVLATLAEVNGPLTAEPVGSVGD
jgi:hypothetical protein